jgi:MFS family permease
MEPSRPLSPWRTFTIASIAVFPAPRRRSPAVSTADLSWVLNAYTVVYAALLAPAGRLADEYGRKRMFLIGVSVFPLASLGRGFALSAIATPASGASSAQ